jgi:hypothetical protein
LSPRAQGDTESILGNDGLMPTQVAQITNQPGLLLAEQVGDLEN